MKINLERKRWVLLDYMTWAPSINEGSQGRNTNRATGDKNWSRDTRGMVLIGLLCMAQPTFFFTTQDPLPRSVTTHSGLVCPTVIINQHLGGKNALWSCQYTMRWRQLWPLLPRQLYLVLSWQNINQHTYHTIDQFHVLLCLL